MSVLADTCGWIEWLADGPLTDHYGPSLDYLAGLLVPTCLQFEPYNWAKRGRGEPVALQAIAFTDRLGRLAPSPWPLV